MVSVSRSRDQWNRIKTCKYGQMIVERGTKAIQRRMVNLFNSFPQIEYLYIHTPKKWTSKWIMDLNVKYRTVTLLEESLYELGLDKDFWDVIKVLFVKETYNKLDFI